MVEVAEALREEKRQTAASVALLPMRVRATAQSRSIGTRVLQIKQTFFYEFDDLNSQKIHTALKSNLSYKHTECAETRCHAHFECAQSYAENIKIRMRSYSINL